MGAATPWTSGTCAFVAAPCRMLEVLAGAVPAAGPVGATLMAEPWSLVLAPL